MNARIDTLHATAPTTPLPLSAEQQIGRDRSAPRHLLAHARLEVPEAPALR